jgi:predicted anti-sigma-YlaC factor YlaD
MPADETEERDLASAYAARERAKRLYLRGRDYGLRGLEASHPGFVEALQREPRSAVERVTRDDVPLLHWSSVAWGAAISLAKDDASMLGGIPAMREMARRALELDEAYAEGALHTFQISLAMASAQPEVDRLRLARAHFERVLALSAGRQAAPYVTYAESVAAPLARRDEFDRMIQLALDIDDAAPSPSRLSNGVFQRRARWLRSHADRFFSN